MVNFAVWPCRSHYHLLLVPSFLFYVLEHCSGAASTVVHAYHTIWETALKHV